MSGEKKADLKRDGTMQITAKEGVKFLMGTGDKELLEMQGLVPQADKSTEALTSKDQEEKSPSKPRLPRDSTMVVTAKV